MDFYTFRLSLVSDSSEYHNGPQIMAALGLTCQGRPAIHALEAGGLLCLLAPGVPAHEALHVFDLDVQVQALGAPLLSLPEGAVGLRVLPLTAARGKVMVGFPQPVMEQVSLSMSMLSDQFLIFDSDSEILNLILKLQFSLSHVVTGLSYVQWTRIKKM